jgi:hypothetical protein
MDRCADTAMQKFLAGSWRDGVARLAIMTVATRFFHGT